MPSEVEYAWLAGLFEGEGYIAFSKGRPKRLTIEMTDLDILQRVLSTFGGVLYEPKSRNPKWKKTWVWSISGEDSRNLVKKNSSLSLEKEEKKEQKSILDHIELEKSTKKLEK